MKDSANADADNEQIRNSGGCFDEKPHKNIEGKLYHSVQSIF